MQKGVKYMMQDYYYIMENFAFVLKCYSHAYI